MENQRNIAPVKLELLLAIVHNSKLAYYSRVIQSHQSNIQFTVAAKGTTHLILNYLGLSADRPKTLISAIVRADQAGELIDQLKETFLKGGDYKGVAFTVRLTSTIGALAYGFLADERSIKEQQ